jgi:hypothetical protein
MSLNSTPSTSEYCKFAFHRSHPLFDSLAINGRKVIQNATTRPESGMEGDRRREKVRQDSPFIGLTFGLTNPVRLLGLFEASPLFSY